MFRAIARDKRVYDMVADNYGILWIIAPGQFKINWKLEWLIDVNLAIVYLPSNSSIKTRCQNEYPFYVRQLKIEIILGNSKSRFLWNLYIITSLRKVNQCEIWTIFTV